MFVKGILASGHPLLDAYWQADWLGKGIYFALFALSLVTWTILLSKAWNLRQVRRASALFSHFFVRRQGNPLTLEWDAAPDQPKTNPFYHLFFILKQQTKEILQKNHHFAKKEGHSRQAMLTSSDIEYIESHAWNTISLQAKNLDHNLFLLATVMSLAPFLGLLGTVWGILSTFSGMQTSALSQTNQAVLQGLSLALATTVLGLIDAIPALIGYYYLKNANQSFQKEMESFSHEVLSAIELQYREVEVSSSPVFATREG